MNTSRPFAPFRPCPGRLLPALAGLLLGQALAAAVPVTAPPETEARIDALVAAMTLDEKCLQLRRSPPDSSPPSVFKFRTVNNDRLGIPGFTMADGPHGIRGYGSVTFYPMTIAMAATWDPAAVEALGVALGRDALAAGRNVLLAPAIDINWDPRNGRTGESLGEDPYLAAPFAIALTRGVQSTRCIPTIKHMHGHAREKMPNRKSADYAMDRRTLEELFGYPYRRAIQEADAWGLMSAHPLINGVHCTQSTELLDEILRRSWGYRYFVVADWSAVYEAGPALRAGNEMVMGNTAYDDLEDRVRSGEIAMATIDEAVRRVLRAKFASGLMEKNPAPRPLSSAEAAENRAAGLEVARKAIVLLRNKGPLLPLRPEVASIALVGPNAERCVTGIAGSSFVQGEGVSTGQALRVLLPRAAITSVRGCGVNGDDRSGFAAAVIAARAAEVVVFVGGLDDTQEGERIDRVGESVQLPAVQQALIRDLAAANPRLVVVLQGGSVCALRDCLDAIPALVQAWHGGQDGGTAVAEVLTGRVNPGGKLPLTIPRGDAQLRDWDATDFRGAVVDGFGYRRYDSLGLEPAFPFGHGLSYTSFTLDQLEIHGPSQPDGVAVRIRVRLQNTGRVAGDEVVQLYLSREGKDVANPPRQLRQFRRVTLEPGERRMIDLELGPEELCRWSDALGSLVVDAGRYRVQVGTSSRDLPLAGGFMVAQSQRYDSIRRELHAITTSSHTPVAEKVGFLDPLTAVLPPDGAPWRTNQGGVFEADGWRMVEPRGYLRIDLGPGGAPDDGELEVTVTGLDLRALTEAIGPNRKVHLLNLFSNPLGDHHAEDGGTESDALWTIRAGTSADGSGRYAGDLKLLWASRGAKRTPGSDYHEERLKLPAGWSRGADDRHRVVVQWSRKSRELRVQIDSHPMSTFAWAKAGDRLRYVYLGGAPDFHAWPGATFSNLRIRSL